MKKEELKQLIDDNVEVYEDFEDFKKYTNFTLEEFNDELEEGLFRDLTPCEGETLLGVLEEEVTDDGFFEREEQLNEDNPDNQTNLNDVDALIEDYLEMYDVFYIKSFKKYFVDFRISAAKLRFPFEKTMLFRQVFTRYDVKSCQVHDETWQLLY